MLSRPSRLGAGRVVRRELGTPTHVGKNGQVVVLKLATDLCLAAQMLTFAEGVLLAERGGMKLPDQAWFDIDMLRTDVRLGPETGRTLGLPLPSTAAVAV